MQSLWQEATSTRHTDATTNKQLAELWVAQRARQDQHELSFPASKKFNEPDESTSGCQKHIQV